MCAYLHRNTDTFAYSSSSFPPSFTRFQEESAFSGQTSLLPFCSSRSCLHFLTPCLILHCQGTTARIILSCHLPGLYLQCPLLLTGTLWFRWIPWDHPGSPSRFIPAGQPPSSYLQLQSLRDAQYWVSALQTTEARRRRPLRMMGRSTLNMKAPSARDEVSTECEWESKLRAGLLSFLTVGTMWTAPHFTASVLLLLGQAVVLNREPKWNLSFLSCFASYFDTAVRKVMNAFPLTI